MKQWIMMVGGFLSWIPASLFSQTLWVTSLDSIDLDKSVADLKDCYAVEFLLETPAAEELPVDIYLSDIRKRDLRELQLEEPSHVRKVCLTARSLGKKRQVLTVPIKAFDTPMASEGVLRRIRSIALDVKGEKQKEARLLSARILEGNSVHAHASRASLAAEPGETVVYPVTVKNLETRPQTIHFSIKRYGWERLRLNCPTMKCICDRGRCIP